MKCKKPPEPQKMLIHRVSSTIKSLPMVTSPWLWRMQQYFAEIMNLSSCPCTRSFLETSWYRADRSVCRSSTWTERLPVQYFGSLQNLKVQSSSCYLMILKFLSALSLKCTSLVLKKTIFNTECHQFLIFVNIVISSNLIYAESQN